MLGLGPAGASEGTCREASASGNASCRCGPAWVAESPDLWEEANGPVSSTEAQLPVLPADRCELFTRGFVCRSTSVGPGKYSPAGPQAAAQAVTAPRPRQVSVRKETLWLGWTQSQRRLLSVLPEERGRGRGHALGFGVCLCLN